MRLSRRATLAFGATLPLAAPGIVRGQGATVELTGQYSIPVLFRDLMEDVGRAFMRENPNIRITWRAAEESYETIMQRHLRDAITNTLPDIAFHGLNRQRTLVERNIPVDLRPFMAADPETPSLGLSPALLSLGQVEDRQVGLGFAMSTPIFYYNMDLIRASGWKPAAPGVPAADPASAVNDGVRAILQAQTELPTTWDDMIGLARAIHDAGANRAQNTNGLFYDWTITGNWAWMALVFSHGGTMLNAEETRVAFGDEPGRRALHVLRRMVDEGRMPDLRPETAFADMFAGRLGIHMQSTAQLGRFNREIGGRFPLACGRFPLASPAARLPSGGNAGMMFTKDPAKQQAAWKFLKFACGPVGATMMVRATGYIPGTSVPAGREDMLAGFYRENPNHLIAIRQQPQMTGWYAFPGQNALRITDVVNDHLQGVVARRAEPDAAMDRMVADVQRLLPRGRG